MWTEQKKKFAWVQSGCNYTPSTATRPYEEEGRQCPTSPLQEH